MATTTMVCCVELKKDSDHSPETVSECSPQGQEEGNHRGPRPQPCPFLTQAHTLVNDPVTEQPPFTPPRLSPALEDLKKWLIDQSL